MRRLSSHDRNRLADPVSWLFGNQDSWHSSVIGARSSVGFDAVAQGGAGAGVDRVGVVEDAAEFVDGDGVPWRGDVMPT